MRPAIVIVVNLLLCVPWFLSPAQATSLNSTAPEKMLPRADAKKMRACDERAMRENVPMEQKSAFVKKCMAEMK